MIEVAESTFDLSQSLNYTLSIRFVPDGFCFAITNSYDNKLLYFVQASDSKKTKEGLLHEISVEKKFLQQTYNEVYFINDAPCYTLIPSQLFEDKDKDCLWQLCFGEKKKESIIFCDTLKTTDITVLHEIEESTVNLIRDSFASVQFINKQSIQILSSLLYNNKDFNRSLCHIYLHNNSFDAVVIENRKVILANTFSFQNNDEFLYFVLNLFEQFNLDQYKTALVISGLLNKADEKISQLQKYIQHIQINKDPLSPLEKTFLKCTECTEQITLLNLPLCV